MTDKNNESNKSNRKEFLDGGVQFVALLSSISFALGLCVLQGEYLAYGNSFFRFVVFEDVVSSAIQVMPFVFFGLTFRLVFFFMESEGDKKQSLRWHRLARFIFVVSIVLSSIIFWFLPEQFTLLFLPLSIIVFISMMKIVRDRVSVGVADPVSEGISLLFGIALIFTVHSYTSAYTRLDQIATHTVCIFDECKQANLLGRLTSGLILKWVDDEAFTFLPTSSVRSISSIARPKRGPILDLLGWWRSQEI